MEERLALLYHFLARNWNAFLAGASLLGVAVFSLIPPLQRFVSVFVFLAANAVVWTVIEIKSDLSDRKTSQIFHRNMRAARPYIIRDIEQRLSGSAPDRPLRIALLGGRIRSMSDIVRELADDLRSGRCEGHVAVRLYCIDPSYISTRLTPGGTGLDRQQQRNSSYGLIIQNIRAELEALSNSAHGRSTLKINIFHYREDPHSYCYIIGEELIYWGPYTWSEENSDFIGPENPCYVVNKSDATFSSLRDWLTSRMRLYELESYTASSNFSVPTVGTDPA